MNYSPPSPTVSAAIDEAAPEADYLMTLAKDTEDPVLAREMRQIGHTLAYMCWLFGHRQEILRPYNWKVVALEEYPAASREEFMHGFSLEEHLHALGKFVNEFWSSPEANERAYA